MTDFDFSILINFIDTFIENFKLKGVESISKINGVQEEPIVTFDNENEELIKEKQHVIYTAGVNMVDIRYVNGVDINTTICNDIVTIYELFGVDAARAALIKEFQVVMTGKVNFQHLEILVDIMTNSGHLTSIDRHGMNKSETDPLSRASFEKTVDQLLQAAVFGEVDHMKSVSSRIMAGLAIKGGTGLCNIILDADLLEKSEYTEDIEQQYVKTYSELSMNTVMTDMMNKDIDGIFMPEMD
jgi:DNA-directed RNA polymerase II subunit RPB1